MAGCPAADLIGANHNLIRHPDMPRLAYITADLDERGNIISYTSVRKKAPQSAIDTMIPIYKLLLEAEKRGGLDASSKVLNDFLNEKNLGYDEFIINLQKEDTV